MPIGLQSRRAFGAAPAENFEPWMTRHGGQAADNCGRGVRRGEHRYTDAPQARGYRRVACKTGGLQPAPATAGKLRLPLLKMVLTANRTDFVEAF
jgi:hypothetical protein